MTSRRIIGGLIRVALVFVAIFAVSRYLNRGSSHKAASKHIDMNVKLEANAPPDSLGPGDLRIYNSDSTVDLVLRGNDILAGLSPRLVEQIKAKIDTSTSKDSTGIGAGIAKIVKKSVAGAIGTHAVFPVADIDDIRYERDQIVIDWKSGRQHSIFENANVNNRKASKTFRQEDAERFIAAVKSRMDEK